MRFWAHQLPTCPRRAFGNCSLTPSTSRIPIVSRLVASIPPWHTRCKPPCTVRSSLPPTTATKLGLANALVRHNGRPICDHIGAQMVLLQCAAQVWTAGTQHPYCGSRIGAPAWCARRVSAVNNKQIAPRRTTTSLTSSSSVSIHSFPFRFAPRFQMDGARAQKQENQVREAATPISDDSQDILQEWPKVALYLFGLGFVLGPLLDGIHSRVELQIYERGAVDIAGLHTNIWVFPMLGLFYSVVGVLQLVLDKYLARKGNFPTSDLRKVVLSFVTLATLLEVSAELYKAGVPFNIEAYTLFFLAEANWLVFENTWWGFGLATLVGIACPLLEVPLNKLFGLWHYPKGNVEIFGESTVTWVLACYFFYTPFISNLARYLSSITRTRSLKKRLD